MSIQFHKSTKIIRNITYVGQKMASENDIVQILNWKLLMNVSDRTDLAQRKDFDIQTKVCNQLCKTF